MRPDVDWNVPSIVHAGKPFEIGVVLVQRAGTKVDSVTLRVFCERMEEDGSSSGPMFEQTVALEPEPKALPERAQYSASFTLGGEVPSSSAEKGVTWWVCVQASIPWWPDLDERTTLFVRSDAPTAATTTHSTHSSSSRRYGHSYGRGSNPAEIEIERATRRGFGKNRPHPKPIEARFVSEGLEIELSFDDRVYAPGDVLRGCVALSGMEGHDVYTLELDLGSYDTTRDARGFVDVTFFSYGRLFERRASFEEGKAMEFEAKITQVARLFENVVVRAHLEYDKTSFFDKVPIDVWIFATPHAKGTLAPLVGRERWREAWTTVAEDAGLDVDAERLSMRGAVGDVSVEIALESNAVRATLGWRSLGLDLRIESAVAFSFSSSKPQVGNRKFRDEHKIVARDRAQAEAFLRGDLVRAIEALHVEAFDDAHGVFCASRAHGHDQVSLAEVVSAVKAIATALSEARARMPPPTGTEERAPVWRDWASRHDATFDVARLAIASIRADSGVLSLRARFSDDGEVNGAVVTLSSERSFAGDVPDDLRPRFESAPRVEPHAVVLELDALPDDPSSVEDVFAALDEIAARLAVDGPHGPYR